jgi:hypothetical protein
MIQIHTFKLKEKERGEGRPQLGGQWKVPMFGGPWKEKEKNKKKHPFIYFHFLHQQILLNFFFPIDLKVLLYHGSRSLLKPFLPFP